MMGKKTQSRADRQQEQVDAIREQISDLRICTIKGHKWGEFRATHRDRLYGGRIWMARRTCARCGVTECKDISVKRHRLLGRFMNGK